MALIRLDKYICDMGLATRSNAKKMIKDGRFAVDGAVSADCGLRFDPDTAAVSMDGRELSYRRMRYFAMDKPAGVLTATADRKQKTVLELLPPEVRRMGVFPVGRLDKDTTGILLFTNDGEFAHKVISPASGIKKTYRARVDGVPDEGDVRRFREGITLADGTKCLPAELKLLGGDICLVTVMEGKYHQIKRMLASVGKPVKELRRLSVGGLKLPESLPSGGIFELSEADLCIVMDEK